MSERALAGLAGSYSPSSPGDWPSPPPTTIQDGLDDLIELINSAVLVTWANDLAGSNHLHQWVAGISGMGGGGGIVPLQTLTTIELTQGGTLVAPAQETPLVFQPRDPTYAPFLHRLFGAGPFNGIEDYVYALGYNVGGAVAAKPRAEHVIESSFSTAPGAAQLEHYVQCSHRGDDDGAHTYRPWSYVIDLLGTAHVSVGLQYASAGGSGAFLLVGGPVGGPAVQQWQVTDGLFLFEPAGYNVEGAGALTISAAVGRMTVQSLDAVGGEFLQAAPQEFEFFDNKQFGKYNETPTAQADNAAGLRMWPITDGSGSIGIFSHSWSVVHSKSLHCATTTQTAAYTIDSGSVPDSIILVSTSATPAFALTLPDPTVNRGRRLRVVDIGGNLAAAQVTLTPHAAETINGGGALALATNRGSWDIDCDGTNWFTGKKVTGG